MTNERKTRKTRADSKESAVEAFVKAGEIIEPPSDMTFTNQQHLVFSEVIDEFANVDWTRHTVRLAAILARALVELQTLQESLIDEGYTIQTEKGVRMNPDMSAANMLSSQIMSLRRTLALHATAGANPGDVGKRRKIRRGQQDDAPDNEDDLINT